ncbi:MAG: DUF1735 domain-containing protein [Sphingobacteriales bacterium]|jgi:hypothetical protein|nr:DUF1735 domain-containing protein [Sphingobacteriales bacterium]
MKNIIIILGVVLILITSCTRQFELPVPENLNDVFTEGKIVNKQSPEKEVTNINQNGIYVFSLDAGSEVPQDVTVELPTEGVLSNLISEYNSFKGVSDYYLLSSDYYTFYDTVLRKGSQITDFRLEIKNFNTLPQGNYILPLKISIAGNNIMHLVLIRKDTEFVPISINNKKPMPPGTYACNDRVEPMKLVAYVETNDYDIRNMGQFVLKNSKKPVFDIVVLFAANMNYDAKLGKRVLHFNDKLQAIIKDPEKYIKPLKDRGIMVIIDILPNHHGVGYANFQDYEEALEFAKECKWYTEKLGIDGWDIDEEYADYNVLPSKPVKGIPSYFWFMKAMKEVMPDKLLTLYDYAHPIRATSVDENGKTAIDYIDYSWSDYRRNQTSYAGLPNTRYGKLSIEANSGLSSAQTYSQRNLTDCFGLMMFFNIRGVDIRSGNATTQLSKVTNLFYGEDCVFNGVYHFGPSGQ